jgi:hypothetical protein
VFEFVLPPVFELVFEFALRPVFELPFEFAPLFVFDRGVAFEFALLPVFVFEFEFPFEFRLSLVSGCVPIGMTLTRFLPLAADTFTGSLTEAISTNAG